MDNIQETDRLNYDDNSRSLHAKIKRCLPEEADVYEMIATLLGMSGCIVQFIADNFDVKNMPIEVRYACANIAGNLLSFTSDGKKRKFVQMGGSHDYEMPEQIQEQIYRKMKYIIEILYEKLKADEKI